ncbi:sigma-70 family RNA polymerase sigma factor [Streptomyces sp. NPDC088921]|uniref:sigma-70 family RNA polymerase sigma factor n=1 Tax=unclassified Streptomyces TaxID=2593676 RepID=UPI003412F427
MRRDAAADIGQPDGESDVRTLYELYGATLLKFLTRLTFGERQAAEDLRQETILRACKHLDVPPEDKDHTLPWLYTVARRLAVDAARRRRSRPVEIGSFEFDWMVSGDADLTGRVVARHIVRNALPRLSPGHRAVLVELYLNGTQVPESARRLGIPEDTVKSPAHHALRNLREIVGATDAG